MTKIVKMSLAAAVAVAGLNSTASAANLAEWAQNTTLSGYVRYRLNNDMDDATKDGDTTEEAKAVMKFTTPVNDAVTANLKYVSEAKTASAQKEADTSVKEANFVVSAAGATVIAGLQTSQSPFFANNGDTRSHGVTALIPAGPVTIAGAYYFTTVGSDIKYDSALGTGTTANDGLLLNSVTAFGLLGKAGIVDFKLWYATAEDEADVEDVLGAIAQPVKNASATSIAVTVPVGPVAIDAMMTELTVNDTVAAAKDTGITKIGVSGSFSKVDLSATYVTTEKNGGRVAIDNDTDAVSDAGLDKLAFSGIADGSGFIITAGASLTDTISAELGILDASSDVTGTKDSSETDLTVKYQMSKNFYASVLYATGEDAGTDFEYSQIEVKYSF